MQGTRIFTREGRETGPKEGLGPGRTFLTHHLKVRWLTPCNGALVFSYGPMDPPL